MHRGPICPERLYHKMVQANCLKCGAEAITSIDMNGFMIPVCAVHRGDLNGEKVACSSAGSTVASTPEMPQKAPEAMDEESTYPELEASRKIENLGEDEDLVIDGDTEVSDLLVAQRIAESMMGEREQMEGPVEVIPARPRKAGHTMMDKINADLSDDSDDEAPAPKAPEDCEGRLELDKILNQAGLVAIDDSESEYEEVEELDAMFPTMPELAPNAPICLIGLVASNLNGVAVLQAKPDSRAVEVMTQLCTASRDIVGFVCDTFGPVKQPYYAVKIRPGITLAEGDELYAFEETLEYVLGALPNEEYLAQLKADLTDSEDEDEPRAIEG